MRSSDVARSSSTRRVKPMLRGIPDVVAVLVAAPGALALVTHAREGMAALAAAIYAGSLVFLFATSALYHTPYWGARMRLLMRRIDHGAIFVLIAGTYTPVCLLAIEPDLGRTLLAIVWGAAALGAVKSGLWPHPPRWLNTLFYVALGWLIVPFGASILSRIGIDTAILLIAGGITYSLGAFTYARRWPDPAPRVFGYHEVFHLFVIAAGSCHYAAVWSLVA